MPSRGKRTAATAIGAGRVGSTPPRPRPVAQGGAWSATRGSPIAPNLDSTPPRLDPEPGLGPAFRELWAASAASNLGDGVWLVAAPLLAAALTRDPALVAGLAVAQWLPWLLFPLLSGALADRIDRRRAMVAVAVFRASLVGVLGVAVLADRASLPLLDAVFFLLATGETLFDTAASAIVPAVVRAAALPKANARLGATWTAANRFVGPPVGGALFATAAALPFLLGAAGLAAAAALLATRRGSFATERVADPSGGASRGDLRAEIAEGVRRLWRQRLPRTLTLAMALLNLTFVAQVSIMVLVAEERLGLESAGYGALLTAYGVGGVVGGFAAGRVLARVAEGAYPRPAIAIEAATPAAIALTRDPLVVGAVLAFFGVHATVRGALLASLRRELTPDRLRGRAGSVRGLIEYGTAAPGALLGGVLAARFGPTAPFWLGADVGALLLLPPLVRSALSEAEVRTARREAAKARP